MSEKLYLVPHKVVGGTSPVTHRRTAHVLADDGKPACPACRRLACDEQGAYVHYRVAATIPVGVERCRRCERD